MAISRQELKSDQFVSTLDSWYEFYLQYQRRIVIGAIVVACVLAIAYGLVSWYRGRNARAQALLSAGLDTYHAPLATAGAAVLGVTTYPDAKTRAQAAENSFRQAADSYGGTAAGRMARYYLALAEIDAGNNQAAMQGLQTAIASGNATVTSLARNALANLYASQGKNAPAEVVLRQLIDAPSTLVPKSLAMLELADLEARGNPSAATQLYRQILKDYPDSPTAQTAQQQLASLPQ